MSEQPIWISCKSLGNVNTMLRSEWLNLRRKTIGASDTAAICGLSPWNTALGVYLDKLDMSETEESLVMKEGLWLEPMIISRFAEESGMPAKLCGEFLVSSHCPWMHATLDGIIRFGNLGFEVVEAKYSPDGSAWKGDFVPDHYYLQVQHQLCVSGASVGHLVCWVPRQPLKHFVIERDQECIDWIVRRTKSFFTSHVEPMIPPDLALMTRDEARALYPTAKNDTIILPGDGELGVAAKMCAAASRMARYCEDVKKSAQGRLMAAMGENRKALVGDCEIDWRNSSRVGFDMDRFKQDHPELFEQYRKTSYFRTFNIKEKNEDGTIQERLQRASEALRLGAADNQGTLRLIGGVLDPGSSGAACITDGGDGH